MLTGLAYRHNDMEYQRITLLMRKYAPLTPFTGKPACFPLSSQSCWNKVLIWFPHFSRHGFRSVSSMFTTLRSKCHFLRIPLVAGFLLIAASLILAPAAEARNARKAHAAQSGTSGQIRNVRSAVLMDARTGRILYSQNPDVRIPPASLTKIMSMMVTFDAIRSGKVSLADQVRVSRHAARQGGSRMGLRAGERVSLNRLLMGMAVSSGNDASMAVAERVGGSGRAFVRMMNNKARQIGMSSSTFKTPNGLPAAGQYTTARDMARLGYVYLKNNPSALQYHRVRVLKHRGMVTTNKNPLLGACPGADGLKTGWVTASGYNIISTVRRGNTRLIAVILGADSAGLRSHEIRRLVEAGFKSRTSGITVASALTKYSYSNKATASSVKKHKIRRNKATAQASRRTGRS